MPEPLDSMRGRRIWLTGASYGIGHALAMELSRRGANIGLTARSEDKLEQLRCDIEKTGGRAMVLPGDVTDASAMARAAETLRREMGGIDVLVANAGSHVPTDFDSFDVEQCMALMQLNYAGQLNCIAAVLPSMLRDGSGHIVGVASLAGYRGTPSAAAYGASKSAVIHFLESMRFDLEGRGVDVTIVNPGFVRTPLTIRNKFDDMPFIIEPERAARIMSRGIERKRREVTFPVPLNWLTRVLSMLPMALYMLIIRKSWERLERR